MQRQTKYKENVVFVDLQALLQMVQSHDGSIRSVVEKGDALLSSVHYPSIRDKVTRLKRDYTELCNTAVVRTSYKLYDVQRGKRRQIYKSC